MYNTKGHEYQEKEFVSKFLEPGIHQAKIKSIEYVKSQGGTEGMKIIHEGKPEVALNNEGKTADTTWWLSEAAWPSTKDKLTIMADKFKVRDQLDAINTDSAENYVEQAAKIFTGKIARWKFVGEEIKGKEGKQNWFKAKLSGFGFMEILDVSPSKLKFDPNNKYDMVRLPVAEVEFSSNGTTGEISPW